LVAVKKTVIQAVFRCNVGNLPAPEVIAAEIVEDPEAALEQFREILGDLAGC
jgi:hypothetical protein